MGSEQGWNSSDVTASPAGLVWVRRRNGSWWPGRIVRPEELPQKLLSKSGTPIKLLGREDGSMDWYNLEKSKRVKPFRCGEYDEYIEKAKISAVCPNRIVYSTGKYVRREDAILHALELEKAYFSMGSSQKNNSSTTKGNSLVKQLKRKRGRESSGKQPGCRARKQRAIEDNSMQELSQSVVSFELPNKSATNNKQFMQHKRWKTPNDSEDDEGIKRMRDLQEIELGMGSNRKSNRHLQQVHELALPDSIAPAESNLDTNFFSISQLKSNKKSLSLKKQSQVIQEHENVKRKDRRRQLTKVCEGSRVIIPSYCHLNGSCGTQGISENYPGALVSTTRRSGASDTTSPDTSETSIYEALLDACETTALVGNAGLDSEIKDSEDSSMLVYTDNDCTNGLVNIPLVLGDHIGGDYLSINKHNASRKLPPHAVKIQNIRSKGNLLSCFPEGLGESSFTGSGRHEDHVRQKKQKMNLEQHSNGKKLSALDSPSSSRKSQQPFPQCRDSNPSYSKHKVSSQFERMDLDFPLYDIELTVQTSYRGPHVPLVSLMSRLNGKAIVGHPVSVEALEDGTTDAIVKSNDSRSVKNMFCSSRKSSDIIGRRSSRKGRAHLKYNHIGAGCSLKKKISNNKNLRLSPRKIRKLSSISIDHRKGKEDKKLIVEKVGGPVVTCVPLRVVFSRISEALSCCPQAGSIN